MPRVGAAGRSERPEALRHIVVRAAQDPGWVTAESKRLNRDNAVVADRTQVAQDRPEVGIALARRLPIGVVGVENGQSKQRARLPG